MNKKLFLPLTIMAAITTVMVKAEMAMATLSSKELGQLAKNITVRIIPPGSRGSGIIIAKNGNTYKVLTARHVVDSIKPGEEADIQTFDDELHYINTENIKTFGDDWDLAVVEFTTEKDYQTATLGDSEELSPGENVYVAGFPIASQAMNISTLNFPEGKLTAVSSRPFEDGYGIAYNNNTLPGMSGGPVLDEEGYVVGVHGKADTIELKETADPNIRIKSGNNLAIPINYFLELNKGAEIPIEKGLDEEATADDYYIQAAQQSQQKNYESAVDSLNKAVEINPSYDAAYSNRAMAYSSLKNYNQAIADYNQAIAINPLSSMAFNNRGTLYYLLNKPNEASADINLALMLAANPNLVATIFPGTTTFTRRSPSGATFRNCALGVNECLKQFPHLQRNLAIIGDNDGVPLDRSEGYAYYNRAIAYLNLQRYPEARQNLQKAIDLYKKQGSNGIADRIAKFLSQIPN